MKIMKNHLFGYDIILNITMVLLHTIMIEYYSYYINL